MANSKRMRQSIGIGIDRLIHGVIDRSPEEQLSSVLCVRNSNSTCVAATDSGRVLVIDARDQSVVKCVALRGSAVTQLASSVDEATIYGSCRDGSIAVFISRGQELSHLRGRAQSGRQGRMPKGVLTCRGRNYAGERIHTRGSPDG